MAMVFPEDREVALRRENGLYLAEFHLSAKEVHGKLDENQEKSAGVRATSQLSSGHEVTQITVTSRSWSATSTRARHELSLTHEYEL